MKKLPLHWKILLGLFCGILWAVAGSYLGWSSFTETWIAPFGRIFINLLKLIAVPLILFSIIGGIVSLGHPRNLGRLGGRTLLLYLVTTIFAVSLGLLLVNTIQPGKTLDSTMRLENRMSYELWLNEQGVAPKDGHWYSRDPQYAEVVQGVVSQGGLSATEEVRSKLEIARQAKEDSPLNVLEEMIPSNIFLSLSDNRNMLQIIFFSVFLGITLLFIPKKKAKPLVRLTESLTEVFIKMVELVMLAAPYFVFALMAGMVSQMAGDNPSEVLELFKGLSWYVLTVAMGLGFMAFVIYPLLMTLLVKKMTFRKFIKGISPAQMLAFTTSSSAATLPVTLECVEENLKVDKRVSSFVLPIGATVNMDGTSLYQAVAVVFLAQLHMVDLTLVQQLKIVLTATLASIGSAAIPGAGVVMLMVVLISVGLNPAWIGIVLPVDRILDMLRTVVNVTGDATVATIVGKTTSFPDEDSPKPL
jgi:Na+/H+-dicarboxylate symporter